MTPGVQGEDTFKLLAKRAILIIDRVVIEEIKGGTLGRMFGTSLKKN